MEEFVLLKLVGEAVDIMCQVNPKYKNQRNRRGRMILDLSFAVRRRLRGRKQRRLARQQMEDMMQPSVNNTTLRQAPERPVKELGNVLPRLLDFMATTRGTYSFLQAGYRRRVLADDC